MSTLKVDAIRHNSATSDAITTHSDGTASAKIIDVGGAQLSNRNKVHNGSFLINQRGGSFTSTSSEYIMDRFEHVESASFTFDTTTTQDSSGPVGFRKCLKITPDSTQTPTGGQNAMIQHKIEGQDLQDLCFGTSSAKKITLSFYAKSAAQNNNHQYTLQIRKYDDSDNRNMLNRAFTVTSSWQRFTMTFDGDTAENIRNDNGVGMQLLWHLADGPDDIHAQVNTFSRTTNSSRYTAVTGQSNFMDNTNNEFYLTGIQLEVGDTATSFEHRSYGDELSRCQRYYNKVYDVGGQSGEKPFLLGTYLSNSELACVAQFPKMRDVPALNITNGTNKFMIRRNSASDSFDTLSMRYGTSTTAELYTSSGVSGTAGQCGIIRGADTDVYIAFSAEF